MSGMSNLQLRIVSGVILAAVVLVATWAGGIWFRILAVAIGAGIWVEWKEITGRKPANLVARLAELGLIASFAAILIPVPAIWVLAGLVASLALALVAYFGNRAVGWMAPGILYSGLPALSLAYLRGEASHGLFIVLFLFAIVWATDIFAYFVGRSLGGPKLAPSISPGKTWSGAVGGAAAAVAAGLCVAMISGPWGNPSLVFLILAVSIVSQCGDLFESWVKRKFGVKDSGTIIPGHGGVMDRVDGLAVAAVALYFLDSMFRAI